VVFSIYLQISLIGIAAAALGYCAVGYRYARFVLPVFGVFFAEIAIYLFVAETLGNSELFGALFYGGTAIVVYVLLFFILRLSGFLTGVMGAGLFLMYVAAVFGLFDLPYLIPAVMTLCILFGLVGAVYKRVGVIVVSSVLGASVAMGVAAFFMFVASNGAIAKASNTGAMYSFVKDNAMLLVGAVVIVTALGIFVQLRFTGNIQALRKRAAIHFQNKRGTEYRMDNKKNEEYNVK